MQQAFKDCIASAHEELAIEIARTPEQVVEAQKLRYRVYCEERGFEPGEDGLERDRYDTDAHHVLVRSRENGNTYGTVRVAMTPAPEAAEPGFPMEKLCAPRLLAYLPRRATGEVSRFALLRDRAGISPAAAALMRLCLIQGVIRVSGENGLSHLCALMEHTLLRLLRSTSIHFDPIGPTIEFRGTRQPSTWRIGEGLARVRRENPLVWSFITLDGTAWSEQQVSRRIAA